MPLYTLIIKTYQKQVKGKTIHCGTIAIKGGSVLREALDKSTFKELSRELRKSNLIPTSVQFSKKGTVEFQFESKKPLL